MKKFIVFGLGLSGIAAIKFLLKKEYQVIATDDNELSLSNLDKDIKNYPELYKNLNICYNLDQINWKEISCLILSPGVPLKYPEPHIISQLAQKNNCPIICDIELLYLFNKEANYIGITGTNGKSTTTALIGHILQKNNINCQIGGNIGIPCLELEQSNDQTYVLEMSSYQLDLIKDTRFHIALLLNITPDHLDRHKNMEGYIKAKKRIFLNQKSGDFAIINIDNKYCKKTYEELRNDNNFTANLIPFSTKTIVENGISIIDDKLYNNIGTKSEIKLPQSPFLKGEHNKQNIAATFAACLLSKINQNQIINALTSFKGLKHRMQLVDKIDNINFINDSKGTNAVSTEQALKSYRDVYWILGGRSKSGGIKSLSKYFSKIKYAFLIGESEEEFAKILEKNKVKYYKCHNLENAFKNAVKKAEDDDDKTEKNILLSPACSSFDQWKNFEERGDFFCNLVKLLKNNKNN